MFLPITYYRMKNFLPRTTRTNTKNEELANYKFVMFVWFVVDTIIEAKLRITERLTLIYEAQKKQSVRRPAVPGIRPLQKLIQHLTKKRLSHYEDAR